MTIPNTIAHIERKIESGEPFTVEDDAMVAEALGWLERDRLKNEHPKVFWQHKEIGESVNLPAFTTGNNNLTAPMRHLPEGYGYTLGTWDEGQGMAFIFPNDNPDNIMWQGIAPTPCLALTLAILKWMNE